MTIRGTGSNKGACLHTRKLPLRFKRIHDAKLDSLNAKSLIRVRVRRRPKQLACWAIKSAPKLLIGRWQTSKSASNWDTNKMRDAIETSRLEANEHTNLKVQIGAQFRFVCDLVPL